MPSNVSPRRAAPTGRDPTARWRPAAVRRAWMSSEVASSRQANSVTSSRSPLERWSPTANRLRRSTSSPQRSMRTGWSKVAGKTSTIEPRTASSPWCSTCSSRRYPPRTRRSTNSSRSMRSPRRTVVGASDASSGASCWVSARTGATTTRGRPRRAPSTEPRSRQRTSSRLAIVVAVGLTRSKGRVSQAANRSTSSGPRKVARSWARRSASAEVATTTSAGRRADRRTSSAITRLRAGPLAASTTFERPSTSNRAGSSRRSAGRSVGCMVSRVVDGAGGGSARRPYRPGGARPSPTPGASRPASTAPDRGDSYACG